MKHRLRIIIPVMLLVAVGLTFVFRDRLVPSPTDSTIPARTLSPEQERRITTVADDLDTPWAVAVLPDSSLLSSERGGTIRLLGSSENPITVADVVEQGEGGLLGLAIHPEFADNRLVYIYKTTDDGRTNVVERYRFQDDRLQDQDTVLADIPAATNHNGGLIAFGPDDKLYVTTGDAGQPNDAQNTTSLAGKILRVNDDGTIPADNPFENPVWSYGHRNPQGLTWDNQGRLWSTEHGPSGSETGFDELNLVKKGGNYGWPLVRGAETRDGLTAPVAQSGADETWAPGGLAYAGGSLYFSGLRAETLYQANINGDGITLSRHLTGGYGRLRAVTADGNRLLISTSNRDGRGSVKQGDDRILSVPLSVLN